MIMASRDMAHWYEDNNLPLNGNKTKELITDFRMGERCHVQVCIYGTAVERVKGFRLLRI